MTSDKWVYVWWPHPPHSGVSKEESVRELQPKVCTDVRQTHRIQRSVYSLSYSFLRKTEVVLDLRVWKRAKKKKSGGSKIVSEDGTNMCLELIPGCTCNFKDQPVTWLQSQGGSLF